MRVACKASYVRVLAFLRECGVHVATADDGDEVTLQQECLADFTAELLNAGSTFRIAHGAGGRGAIVRHSRGAFLNRHHRQLAASSSAIDLRQLAEHAFGSPPEGHHRGGRPLASLRSRPLDITPPTVPDPPQLSPPRRYQSAPPRRPAPTGSLFE